MLGATNDVHLVCVRRKRNFDHNLFFERVANHIMYPCSSRAAPGRLRGWFLSASKCNTPSALEGILRDKYIFGRTYHYNDIHLAPAERRVV